MIARLTLVALAFLGIATAASAAQTCAPATIPVDGNRLWVDAEGEGAATVVFEAGFGNDSRVWSAIEPRVRAAGVRTLVYDRAGMGQSTIDTAQPYSLDNDVRILRAVLDGCGVKGPVVFVGHSYGGAIGLVAASRDDRIKGLVLLDSVAPGVWTPAEVDKNLAAMRPQYDEIRQKAPGLAKVAIPFAEAMPATAAEVNALHVSDSLPIIDVVAENGQSDPDSAKVWRAGHQAFVAGHPARTFVLAEGSGHKVMLDKPDLTVEEVLTMIKRVGGR